MKLTIFVIYTILVLALGAAFGPMLLAPPPRARLECAPCDGRGGVLAVATRLPVPVAVVMTHRLCFSNDGKDRCWYGCPGTIEESFARGLELCGGPHGN